MILNRCVRLVSLLAVALAGASTGPSPAMADGGANLANFGVFGLAPGERARLNVVNVSTGTACSIELRFFQGRSDAVPPSTSVLAPGDSASLVVPSSSRGRREFRAQVTDLENSEALNSDCIATLELFTKERTVALLQHQ